MGVNDCTISAPTFIATRMHGSVLDAARIIIRFYYRLTIGRDAACSIEMRLGRRHVQKQAMVSASPDRRSAEEKEGRNSAGNCAAAGVTVVVNSIVTSATDFIIDVARVTYKDQLGRKSSIIVTCV